MQLLKLLIAAVLLLIFAPTLPPPQPLVEGNDRALTAETAAAPTATTFAPLFMPVAAAAPSTDVADDEDNANARKPFVGCFTPTIRTKHKG